MIRCKRVYLTVTDDDGQRVLVDRLWPHNSTTKTRKGSGCAKWHPRMTCAVCSE